MSEVIYGSHTMTILEHALKYAARGWKVFPCHQVDSSGQCSCGVPKCHWPENQNAGKHPRTQNGYKDATLEEDQIRLWWGKWPTAPIGVACAPSGLIVIDIDPRNGGDSKFNEIQREIGKLDGPLVKTGSGGWHIYMLPFAGSPKGVLERGIDIKFNGYVIAPPSMHPCGKPYQWEQDGEPTEAPDVWVKRLLKPARPLSIVGAPGDCKANEVKDALTVIPSDDYETWIQIGMSIKAAVGDDGITMWDEWSSTAHNYDADAIPKHWGSFSEGGGITQNTLFGLARQHGWRPPLKLVTIEDIEDAPPRTDDDVPQELHADAEHIDIGPTAPNVDGPPEEKPVIRISPDITVVVDAAEDAILNMPRRNLYQRSGGLVRIARDASPAAKGQQRPPGSISIKPATPAYLMEICSRAATWWKLKARPKQNEDPWARVTPPQWAPATLAERGQWRIPPIMGIIAAPTLRIDGTLLNTPGYDYRTGLLYLPGGAKFPELKDIPTKEDASRSLDELSECFDDFPFTEPSDKSAALCAILSLVCRAAIAGPVPIFAIRATAAGTGKTLLADIIAIIGTGRAAPKFAQAQNPEEEKKRLLAVAMEGDPCFLIDNVDKTLGSGALDSAVTAGVVKDRVLGKTGNAEAPFRPVVMATGNNLQVRGDTGRRMVPVDMDAKCERPELRGDWAHPNITQWVTKNRPRLVCAALTVCRAHACAGWPEVGLAPIGTFEDFSRVARAPIVWAGIADPCAGRERIRAEGDSDLDTLRDLLGAWRNHYDVRAVLLRDVAEEISGDLYGDSMKRMKEAVDEAISEYRRGTVAGKLGYYLRKYKGRVVDGMRLETGDKEGGGVPWRVVIVEASW